ncbi:MAG: hypothetical protein EBQ92_00900 [Proteobacteria bacterium]|nr:hypothetical protein [Pseudomonadota bacterium]
MATKDINKAILDFLQTRPDGATTGEIVEAVGGDRVQVKRHIQYLRGQKHIRVLEYGSGRHARSVYGFVSMPPYRRLTGTITLATLEYLRTHGQSDVLKILTAIDASRQAVHYAVRILEKHGLVTRANRTEWKAIDVPQAK